MTGSRMTVVWFLDRYSNPKFRPLLWPLRVNMDSFWLKSFGHTGTRRCFCSSANKSHTHRADLKYVRSNTRWHVPYNRLNLPVMSEMVLHRFSLAIFLTFSVFPSVRSAERRPERHHFYHFPHVWIKKTTQKSVFSPWHCHRPLSSALQMQPSRVWNNIRYSLK